MENIQIAHIRDDTGEWQTVEEHNKNVALLAREFAIPELKELCYSAGLLHDVGKESKAFQRRIRGSNERAEHAIYGAKLVEQYYEDDSNKAFVQILKLCIAGHHTGIPDSAGIGISSLQERMMQEVTEPELLNRKIVLPVIDGLKLNQYLLQDCDKSKGKNQLIDKYAFFVRYVFSCLTDADSLDTETFCNGSSRERLTADFSACLNLVNDRFRKFTPETELQKTRAVIQQQVFEHINQYADIYLMNMPTGSGKTLAGVKFALERVQSSKGKLKKKRIIYIIPYNSIIDQTAEIFQNLFKDKAKILRHQSTYSAEEIEKKAGDEDYHRLLRQASENWDADFIITTAVQFFESIYGNKRNKLRKLHNMADSIMVFDEIHTMPISCLQPCLEAISYIVRYLNSEALFMTATMPDFRRMFERYTIDGLKICDLVPDKSLFKMFSRCSFENIGLQTFEALLIKAREYPSSLLIVNSRKAAREIYALAEQCGGNVFHLTTYMTPFDRTGVLHKIRILLDDLWRDYPNMQNVPDERRICVVATSLIEAGIDMDCSCVFRELAGIDNILQAAGRCNREGKLNDAKTYIFELKSGEKYNGKTKTGDIVERQECTVGVMKEYVDISAPEAVSRYYQKIFALGKSKIENSAIHTMCDDIWSIPFRSYADHFHMIESNTVSIIVNQNVESKELIRCLRETGHTDHRKLQKYTCSIKVWEFENLWKQGIIADYGDGMYCLINNDYYDDNMALQASLWVESA